MSKKVHISEKLTSKKILEILNENEDLEEITCPKSLFDNISPKYIEALSELNIVIKEEYNYKKESKYCINTQNEIMELIKKGNSVKEISDQKKIPEKTVYWLINKNNSKNKKNKNNNKNSDDTNNNGSVVKLKKAPSKYSFDELNKIIEMYQNGFSPKEISEKLDINIRTVYRHIKKNKKNKSTDIKQ
ncbi:MAG: helix-turn-helix domain-containing protein [Methanobacteriaceae archaeon]